MNINFILKGEFLWINEIKKECFDEKNVDKQFLIILKKRAGLFMGKLDFRIPNVVSQFLYKNEIKNAKRIILETFKEKEKFDLDIVVMAVKKAYGEQYSESQITSICVSAINDLISERFIRRDFLMNSTKPTFLKVETRVRQNEIEDDYQH